MRAGASIEVGRGAQVVRHVAGLGGHHGYEVREGADGVRTPSEHWGLRMTRPLIHGTGEALPPTRIAQPQIAELFAEQPGMSRLGARLTRAVFANAGVDSRRTVLPELSADAPPWGAGDYRDAVTGALQSPTTGVRNRVYAEEAPGLFAAAARAALADAPHLDAGLITHVVTVSCTGFFAPGPDVRLVADLGLRADVARVHLGFMGCNAAFGALRTAAGFCAADPDAVVLVVCVELCTLHLHVRNDPDTILGNALFADGAAAVLLSARPAPEGVALPELLDQETALAPAGEGELAWAIGDEGFEMVLGAAVPRIIDEHVTAALDPLLARAGRSVGQVDHWAVHPGGREILDRVAARLALSEDAMAASRRVLAEQGNVSSVTILLVLRRLLAAGATGLVGAMAFGPGLSIESALLHVPEGDGR